MNTERANYRVVKTLTPTARGAIGYAQEYGDALVCVRHRTDAKGKIRHTTVELVVQVKAIKPRSVKMVTLRIGPQERVLQSVILAAGGIWDAKRRLWHLPSRVATILNLRGRVVNL